MTELIQPATETFLLGWHGPVVLHPHGSHARQYVLITSCPVVREDSTTHVWFIHSIDKPYGTGLVDTYMLGVDYARREVRDRARTLLEGYFGGPGFLQHLHRGSFPPRWGWRTPLGTTTSGQLSTAFADLDPEDPRELPDGSRRVVAIATARAVAVLTP
jgi:hypothetical protein